MAMDPQERAELVEMIAQAVVDRIEERERVNRIADQVVSRVMALQDIDAAQGLNLKSNPATAEKNGKPSARPSGRRAAGHIDS